MRLIDLPHFLAGAVFSIFILIAIWGLLWAAASIVMGVLARPTYVGMATIEWMARAAGNNAVWWRLQKMENASRRFARDSAAGVTTLLAAAAVFYASTRIDDNMMSVLPVLLYLFWFGAVFLLVTYLINWKGVDDDKHPADKIRQLVMLSPMYAWFAKK